ncbi:hypothetical protein D3C72_2570370 [compost metagenome]
MQIDFHIGRAEDVPGALQADAANQARAFVQAEPGFVGQGDDALLDQFDVALDLLLIATEAELEGVFEHDGQ